jgi:hypothetical protein
LDCSTCYSQNFATESGVDTVFQDIFEGLCPDRTIGMFDLFEVLRHSFENACGYFLDIRIRTFARGWNPSETGIVGVYNALITVFDIDIGVGRSITLWIFVRSGSQQQIKSMHKEQYLHHRTHAHHGSCNIRDMGPDAMMVVRQSNGSKDLAP